MNNLDRPVNITNGPQGISMIDPVQVAGYPLSNGISLAGQHFAGAYAYYYLFLACTVVVVGVCMRLENSRLGRAWVAIREDEVAAKAMGISQSYLSIQTVSSVVTVASMISSSASSSS
jgi:branched-chain amino acid transport system permease protein